jgi:hypothetical protein
MVAVLGVIVAVVIDQFQMVAAFPVRVQVVEPRVRVLVPAAVAKAEELTDWLLVSSVPLVRVIAPVVARASWSCQELPNPLKVRALPREVPFIEIVFPEEGELNVMAPVYVFVIPLAKVVFPLMARVELPASVITPEAGLPMERLLQTAAEFMVTV